MEGLLHPHAFTVLGVLPEIIDHVGRGRGHGGLRPIAALLLLVLAAGLLLVPAE